MAHLLALALLTLAATSAPAPQNGGGTGTWPGVWGPSRNGAAAVTGTTGTPAAFKPLWRRKTQGGYSEVAVDQRSAFTMEMSNGTDYVLALDPATGAERWRAQVGATYRGHDGSHDGPIGTPAVDGGDVFAVGPHGALVALDAATGRERWRHDLVKTFGAAAPIYGFGTSPLVEGAAVIVQTGGEQSQGLLAFDRATGRLLWNAKHGVRGGYSSPTAATLAGVRQIVAAAGDHMFAVSPVDGRVLWSIAGRGDGESVANPPQILPDDRVLFTTWGESVMLRIGRQADTFTPSELWRSARLRSAYSPTIHHDGHLYGFAGAFLVCADAATGDIKWRHRMYEGTLIGVGAHLLVLSRASGDLHVVEATPKAFAEVMRTTVFTPGATSITGPSLAGNRLYLRNLEEIVALSLEGR